MMISTLLCAIQLVSPVADQSWKLSFTMVGDFGSTPGSQNPFTFKNPSLTGDLTLSYVKSTDNENHIAKLLFKFKKAQNSLIEGLSGGFPEKTGAEEPRGGMYSEKEYAFMTSNIQIDRTKATFSPLAAQDNYGGGTVLAPLGIGLAVMHRATMKPELRKDFFLNDDDGKKFYVTYLPNLNATTNESKGEVAYKFNIKMIDQGKSYPNFFTGAIRLNTKTKIVQYLRATSKVSDGPTGEDSAFSKGEAFTLSLEAK